MKRLTAGILFVFSAAFLSCTQSALNDFGDSLRVLSDPTATGGGLSESKIIQGLKEALEIGTRNAVQEVSRAGGYYENPRIRIPLPEAMKKAGELLRSVGYGKQLDAFEMSMNQAAEQAASSAKTIFWNAIKGMTISDGQRILKGRENEATLYFKEKTYDQLDAAFNPMIRDAMSQVGVTRRFQQLNDTLKVLPFTESLTFDLDQYVTDKGLEGLFSVLADEEKKIRQDPMARVTELLKEVFGAAR